MDNKQSNDDKNSQKRKQTIIILILAAVITLVGMTLMTRFLDSKTMKELDYSEFITMVKNDEVQRVEFNTSGKAEIELKEDEGKPFKITYWVVELNDDELLPLLNEHGVDYKGNTNDSSSVIMEILLGWVLPFVLIYLLMGFLFRRMSGGAGGFMNVGKSKAKLYMEKETGVTFKDVAGQEEAKESVTEIVDFLHNPGKYAEIGAKLPKGALLVGPPGTGKTLLAKAVAGEAHVPFFSLTGSDFVEMYVGVGASRVRDLFKQAQEHAPCIIFIDEIDAIGKRRDSVYGGNDEREQTLNQLLSEMDGFDTSKGILILAATNRPEVLDQALLRPGRFDRRVIVDKPDLKGRVETLRVHSRNVAMDETVDLEAIGLATAGAVGSDLANMINEAAIMAVKAGRKAISQKDLFEAVEVVIAGKEKKDRVMNPTEKKTVAYHEVGHALAAALQKNSEPVQKITIVPRTMGSLGYTMQVPEEEKYLMSKAEMEAELVTFLAGRAAEELVMDSVTTGASNDMEQATAIARAMITRYGMSEKFGLISLETVENPYLGGGTKLNCSEQMAAEIDKEVQNMLKLSYEKAKALLRTQMDALHAIAAFLLEKESITGKEFMDILDRYRGGGTGTGSEDTASGMDAGDSEADRPDAAAGQGPVWE